MKRFKVYLWFFCLLLCFSSLVVGQDTTSESPEAASQELITGTGSEFLILGELALGGGFPGYQLYNLNFGFQKDSFGVNFRGSWTEVGPYFSLSGRYFLPLPVPVPTFVSLGAGYFSESPTGFATIGAQIPFGLSSPFRATIEAGAAVTRGFNGAIEYLPSISLSVGYTFFVDTTPLTEEQRLEQELARSRTAGCVVTEPNYGLLDQVFNDKLNSELARAKVRYAGVYSLNGYEKQISSREQNGNRVTWRGTWSATITEVWSGKQTSGGGDFRADFSWNGCAWNISYSL